MHDGATKNGEYIMREDGTCTGCGGEGTWQITEKHVITAKFHGVTHRLKFNADASEAVLLEPVRNPQTKMVKSPDSTQVVIEI